MKPENVDIKLLEEIETYSVQIAREAGSILLEHFGKSLEISFKGKKDTDPVTTVDKLSEEYLKKAIKKEFPGHSILGEEAGVTSQSDSPFTWVLDPLDGTVNFINGLPFFAVSIGVLRKRQPVAGSIYVPVSHKTVEGVYHGCLGKGTFFNNERITVAAESRRQPLSEIPVQFSSRFRLSGKSQKEPHEARNLGSIAFELALTACGVFRFAVFHSPKLWDVAAGVLLVKEAGGVVFTCGQKSKHWTHLDEFQSESDDGDMSLETFQSWSSPLIAGAPDTVNKIVKDIRVRRTPLSWITKVLRPQGKKKMQKTAEKKAPQQEL